MFVSLLALILGLLLGFYGRVMYDKLSALVEQKREQIEARNVGVVHPISTLGVRGQPIDLGSESGVVMRPTPAGAEEARKAQRDEILQRNHV